MLETQGIIPEDDASAIAEGLERIEDEYAASDGSREVPRSRTSTCMSRHGSPS
jgi:argininosuccinate lyase